MKKTRIKIEITLDIDDPKKEHEAIIMLSDSVGYLGDLISVKTIAVPEPILCTCGVRTFDPRYHKQGCPVALPNIKVGTYTGRMSMKNPNLSAPPKRGHRCDWCGGELGHCGCFMK